MMRCRSLFALVAATTGLALVLASCATSRHAERRFDKKIQKEVEKSPVFSRAFTGFTLLDPQSGQTLADVNGDKYFTPASNTKILTLATCLEVLGDSVPALRYSPVPESSDPVWYLGWLISGTGDPTFLHPKFEAWQTPFELLKKNGFLGLFYRHHKINRFGPGWAWDDFNERYSPELAEMPLYGNMVRLTKTSSDWEVSPPFFKSFLKQRDDYDQIDGNAIFRQAFSDTISLPYYSESNFKPGFSMEIPMWQANAKTLSLLLDTLHYPAESLPTTVQGYNTEDGWHTLYSTPLDTILRRMMHQSDNFIAEQMLLVCAGQKFDILQQDTIVKWMLDSVLISLPQRPRWVDGSGLSRYNLASPRDFAQVLLKLWKEQPHESLRSLFPAGGVNGTVANWYKGKDGKPYVFAKTGSMSGVHCLSGYVTAKRGKTLIFSFMHNHFVGSDEPWKQEMQRILEMIWERY
ncbi:MAG: D-alanyl-D-alanine carboxypeptidase [Saprospiraceae bacterium]|nr:D-alanyl-D-alanine carboxypeptidase [Saprospiraceae bacterium]